MEYNSQYQKFYPNKSFIFMSMFFQTMSIAVLIFACISDEFMLQLKEIVIFVVISAGSLSFFLYGSAVVQINNQFLLYKKNIFCRKTKISLNCISNIYLYYARSKTMEITVGDGKTIKIECDYRVLVMLHRYIPDSKFSIFYIAKNFVPKKHREFLLSTNIPKKGPNSGRGGLK